MKNCNLVDILRSPVVTILVGTLCAAYLLRESKEYVKDIFEPKEKLSK